MVHYARFLSSTEGGIGALLAAWGANESTRGLAWDLQIATVAFFVWAVAETRVRGNWGALVALPVTIGVGLSCGLPLYLFLRTRPVA